jgi:tRNA A-37 threonylcarbamoyl transferase component Bud32
MLAGVLLSLTICLLGALRSARGRLLDVNVRYRGLLERSGLCNVDDFMHLPAVIIGGHRNRHTAHLMLGDGPGAFRAFLKRELYSYWRDYFGSLWAGLGWRSRSSREGRVLQELHAAGIPCPEFIATGEDSHGRAFLLVRELEGTQELRQVLREQPGSDRRDLGRRLGHLLAQLHDCGYSHADLYSKHVHVHPERRTLHLLDWQRAQRRRRLGWRCRLNDLAALDATLTEDLATPRDRLACLRAYLRASRAETTWTLASARAYIRARVHRLLRKRHVREAREAPMAIGIQNLIWLDGEALCLTREFLDALGGQVPAWLRPAAPARGPWNRRTRETISVAGIPAAVLSRDWTSRPFQWLWCRLRGRPFTAPEMRQAACLFRLQRYGIVTPRVLAVGQRHLRPWRSESFLLTEPVPYEAGLTERLVSLSEQGDGHPSYRRLLREAGRVLGRLHESGCYLPARGETDFDSPFGIAVEADGTPVIAVRSLAELRLHRRPRQSRAWTDLNALYLRFSSGLVSRTDALRFLLAYLGFPRPSAAARSKVRDWLRRRAA